MKTYINILCASILCVCTGCPEDITLPDIITTDKNEISFKSSGGCDTITMTANYDSWWMSLIKMEKTETVFNIDCECELTQIVDEQRYYYKPAKHIDMNNKGWHEITDPLKLNTNGVSILIPNEAENKIIVSCTENIDRYDKEITIFLQVDDDPDRFCEITIHQDGNKATK